MIPARTLLVSSVIVLAAGSALAQARKPARPAPPAAAAPQPPPPPAIFPCRTANEVCYLGIVVNGQLSVLYTNAPNADGIDQKPIDAVGPGNAKIDMAPNEGRVVMVTGAYDPAKGLTGAEVVEVASPLVSLITKAQIAGGGADEPPPPAAAGPAPRRR